MQRSKRFRVNNACAVIGQFHRFMVSQRVDFDRVREAFRVGIENARNVFPYGNRFSIKSISQNSGGIVGALATQRSGLVFGGSCDKALRQHNAVCPVLVVRIDGVADQLLRHGPIDVTFAVGVVGTNQLTCVKPFSFKMLRVEIDGDERGGE